MARAAGSVTRLAVPSTTTDSPACSGVTAQRGSAARLRALRELPPVLKAKAPSRQQPQTAARWGAPSGPVVATQ